MLFSPVLKNGLEVGTYLVRLFEHIFGLFIEIKLYTIADNHQVQNEAFVLGLIVGIANHIFDELQVIGDKFFLDVPFGFLDHVGEEDDLDFI